jgi:protein-S-isoprenylcysteine O-methyltransferase Ste14
MENPPLKAVLIGVGGIINLGLAILGWGGLALYFAHPARVALAIVLAVLCIAAYFAGGNISPGVREDRDNRWVLTAFIVLGFLDIFLSPYTERKEFWVLGGDTVRWLGVVLYAVFGGLRLWPVFVLGHRFSGLVAIQPGHKLVTTGVFRYVRNPSYLGLLGGSLGWSLAFRSGVGVLLTALLLLPLVVRMHAEERLLRSEFGKEYDAFYARTWRLIPGVY